MESKKALSDIFVIIILSLITISAVFILSKIMWDSNKGFEITNNQGNSSEFLIKVVNCDTQNINDDFYIDDTYVKMGRYYSERINETHGKMCWYDVIDKENLTKQWLGENCECINGVYTESPSGGLVYPDCNKWSCDKGFIVNG